MDKRIVYFSQKMMSRRGYEKFSLFEETSYLAQKEKEKEPQKEKETALIYHDISPSFNKDKIRIMCEKVIELEKRHKMEINSVILILRGKKTSDSARTIACNNQKKNTVIIEVFDEINMLYDPTESIYTSEVNVISDDKEIRRFLAEDNLSKSRLPKISNDDVIAKYLAISKGSIVIHKRYSLIPETLIETELFPKILSMRPVEKKTR